MLSLSLRKRGFLPQLDPLKKLPKKYEQIDNLGAQVKMRFGSPFLRPYCNHFPVIDVSQLSGLELIRAGVVYLFAQSAYIHNHNQEPATVIPRSLAVPAVTIAEKLRMPPILSYYFYCLNNWRFLGERENFDPDNLHTIQNFVADDCENWFIAIHVAIEHLAGEGLVACIEAQQAIHQEDITQTIRCLYTLAHSLEKMIGVLKRMPERCSSEDYYYKVRPQIHGFTDVIYEGVEKFEGKPQTFRGETGAQSTVIPALKRFLGIIHGNNILTAHLSDMINYMHPLHRAFLTEQPQITFVKDSSTMGSSSIIREFAKELRLCTAYNDCVRKIHQFEEIHFGYAMDYIQKKVASPMGTGGTPFIEWLSKMKDETLSFLIC